MTVKEGALKKEIDTALRKEFLGKTVGDVSIHEVKSSLTQILTKYGPQMLPTEKTEAMEDKMFRLAMWIATSGDIWTNRSGQDESQLQGYEYDYGLFRRLWESKECFSQQEMERLIGEDNAFEIQEYEDQLNAFQNIRDKMQEMGLIK